MRLSTLRTAAIGAALFIAPTALAQTAQTLPVTQNWSTAPTAANDYSFAPGFIGYNGADGSTTSPLVLDPQTVVADLSAAPSIVNLLLTPTTPGTATSGGLYYFPLANPVVAFQGSGTADSPVLQLRVVTTNRGSIRVRYLLRDVDDNADNALQPVALQFRAGTTGDFTNVAAAYIADASAGPALTLDTPVDVTLPSAANNVASLDIRWITGNAQGSDELIGIDDIQVTGSVLSAGGETPNGALTLAVANPIRGAAQVRFSTETAQDARLALYDVLGRRVATLVDGAVSGTQSVTLNTAGLAPGVYVLRLTAGADVLTQTVTVVR
ncbi:MAG TPA: T9SS type A sorting domain-containing protein [Rubricoccaceae bacterium]|jgi:hypothetical protein